MGERPTAALILSLIGGVLIALDGIRAEIELAIKGIDVESIESLAPGLAGFIRGVVIVIIALIIIIGIVIVIGALQIRSGMPKKVRTWSMIVLILSIISLFFGGGFVIGSILSLVGGILGLVWKPSKAESAISTPSPQAPTT
ncbi:MAG: hypothetical protein QXT53_07630 [Ignisphaera sp.]